jgi:very-short-patch-repair endonuclease
MPRPIRGKTTQAVVNRARSLRQEETLAEKRLWLSLRNRQLVGLKFRRQHPYGQFILDLFCVERQLAVEVDGDVHLDPERAAHDAERSEFLAQRGVRVLRFTNEEVEQHLPAVLRKIIDATSPSTIP